MFGSLLGLQWALGLRDNVFRFLAPRSLYLLSFFIRVLLVNSVQPISVSLLKAFRESINFGIQPCNLGLLVVACFLY